MPSLWNSSVLGLTALTMGLVGCADKPASNGPETSPPPATATADTHGGRDHGGHAHPSEGPHHGELIELGNEEYHAELLHTDTELTIYMLDGAATQPVPIEATALTINMTHNEVPKQFSLDAVPDAGDPEGRSSRFVSTDSELLNHIDEEHAEFRLVVTINGKSYNGRFEHDHDHHGHEH